MTPVNGTAIRNMKELAAAFAKQADEYVIEFESHGRPLVFQRTDLESARNRIRQRYNVLQEQFLGDEATTEAR